MLNPADLEALLLTFKVASISTALMLLFGTPLAWWLARTAFRLERPHQCRRSAAAGAAADGIGLLFAGADGPGRGNR